MSYEKAVALPLAISTAACGLYMKAFLNLPYPTKGAKPTNRTILVNGASSAVGYVTVQLAVASGINVIATASPRNFDMVKSLGVQEVFDYNSKSLVEELTSTLKNSGEFAGIYDAISTTETVRLFASVADNLGGGFVVCTLPTPEGLPSSVKADMCKFS
jgi:NADPH:quinone reductase-like Zn-dependent oxidoreductase